MLFRSTMVLGCAPATVWANEGDFAEAESIMDPGQELQDTDQPETVQEQIVPEGDQEQIVPETATEVYEPEVSVQQDVQVNTADQDLVTEQNAETTDVVENYYEERIPEEVPGTDSVPMGSMTVTGMEENGVGSEEETNPEDGDPVASCVVTFYTDKSYFSDNTSVWTRNSYVGDCIYLYEIPLEKDNAEYTFLGWSVSPGAEYAEYSGNDCVIEINDNMELHAVWKENLTLTYDANGGYFDYNDEVKPSITHIGDCESVYMEYLLPKSNDRFWQFEGWFSEPEGGSLIDPDSFSNYVYESGTIFAHWKKPVQMVIGEEATLSSVGEIGAYAAVTANVTDSYTFRIEGGDEYLGVSLYDSEGNYIKGGYPVWDEGVYSHSYLNFGLEAGKTYYLYLYSGQCNGFSCVVTAAASETDMVSVTYYVNNDSSVSAWFDTPETESKTVLVESGNYNIGFNTQYPVVNLADSMDYLRGWSTDPNATEPESDLYTEDGLVLYAVWGHYRQITFDANGGYFQWEEEKTKVETFRSDGNFAIYDNGLIPQYPEEEMLFAGWATEPGATEVNVVEDYTKMTEIEGDTLYAVWGDPITVTYNVNGEGCFDWNEDQTSKTLECVSGQRFKVITVTQFDPDPAIRFDGWYDAAEGGEKYDEEKNLTESITVYAHWKQYETISLTYDANGGYIIDEDGERYSTVTRTGYDSVSMEDLYPAHNLLQFEGWYSDPDAGEIINPGRHC